MKAYIVTVKHDAGKSQIKTTATSEENAISKIMIAEGCPRSAIVKVKEIKR